MLAFNNPHDILAQTRLVERFLRYVRVDSRADPHSQRHPSSEGQKVLLRLLRDDLLALGLRDVEWVDETVLLATLPGNCAVPDFGLIAHVDTAPGFSGADVHPQLHASYAGGDLAIGHGVTIRANENPELSQCIGESIYSADGSTLLGADDKAGVAIALAVVELFQAHPELPRPTLRLAFTPDEEIGRGTAHFPYARFPVGGALTLDGGFSGEVNLETFDADSAWVRVTGVSTHPGTAKGKLVNALTALMDLLSHLPKDETPEHTEGREGFYHLTEVQGDAGFATAHLILRDFDVDALATRGAFLQALAQTAIEATPRLQVEVEIAPSYRNMGPILAEHPRLVQVLNEGVRLAGVIPRVVPIRGGTDGAQLSAHGVPCPNLFAGGVNFHGPTEWICLRTMGESAAAVANILQLWATTPRESPK